MTKNKTFVGIKDVAGWASSIERGFQNMGLAAYFISKTPANVYAYKTKLTSLGVLPNLWQQIASKRSKSQTANILKKAFLVFAHMSLNTLMVCWMAANFKRLIFITGETITKTRIELMFYKFLRKELVFVFTGSDSRPPYMGRSINKHYFSDLDTLKNETYRIKDRIKTVEKYASYCFNHIATGHFHEKPFINILEIGIPLTLKRQQDTRKGDLKNMESIKVLHCPSSKSKGTGKITQAVNELIDEGYQIELKLLQDVPNTEVIRNIRWCDFVVDSIYSDSPMGTFSMEAACFAKPTVVAGYYSTSEELNLENSPPTLYVHPDKIKKAIKFMVVNKSQRESVGDSARVFVDQVWREELVISKIIRVLTGDAKNNWWVVPSTIRYLNGGAVSEFRAQKMIRDYIDKFGADSLCLDDKPILREGLLKFAYENINANSEADYAKRYLDIDVDYSVK
jgi:hypothetical protein